MIEEYLNRGSIIGLDVAMYIQLYTCRFIADEKMGGM